MTTQTLSFEEDYESEEFKAANIVPFTLRSQVFRVKRRSMKQLQDDAEAARTSPTKTTTFEDWFKNNLVKSDFERFWDLANDDDNPVRFSTLRKIIDGVEAELIASEGDEDDPKD